MNEVVCKAKKWGNSIGVILPKSIVKSHQIKPEEELVIEIKEKKSNVLKELFGAGKSKKITRKEFLEYRKLLESKF
jgi:antitoxin component of MazEF toxin-antitoxin module